jgi:hypothetical protein
MKKILAVALACTVSAFAAWDKFPVIEDGKGEAKIEYSVSRQGQNNRDESHGLKIRYSPMANLEVMTEGAGLYGARYQIIPVLSAGVDVFFPIYRNMWAFRPNAQFAMDINDMISLGSNVDFTIFTEEKYSKTTEYMNLSAGAEVDFKIGQSTIWVGFDFETGLGEQGDPKVKASDAGKGTKLSPSLGYIATIGNLAIGTSLAWEFGEKSIGKDTMNSIVGLDASVKF